MDSNNRLWGVLIIICFDMINDIPAKTSQPSFGTTKAVKYSGGISPRCKYILISAIIGKYECPPASIAR